MEMRTCKYCGMEYPISSFKKSEGYITHKCRKCYNLTQKRYKASARKRRASDPKYLSRRNFDARRQAARTRSRVIGHYSGGSMRCSWCHEDDYMVLTIDHINNDGAAHRKNGVVGSRLYRFLVKNKFPPGFDVLCMNCNLAKKINGGTNPEHRRLLHSLDSLAIPCI